MSDNVLLAAFCAVLSVLSAGLAWRLRPGGVSAIALGLAVLYGVIAVAVGSSSTPCCS